MKKREERNVKKKKENAKNIKEGEKVNLTEESREGKEGRRMEVKQ